MDSFCQRSHHNIHSSYFSLSLVRVLEFFLIYSRMHVVGSYLFIVLLYACTSFGLSVFDECSMAFAPVPLFYRTMPLPILARATIKTRLIHQSAHGHYLVKVVLAYTYVLGSMLYSVLCACAVPGLPCKGTKRYAHQRLFTSSLSPLTHHSIRKNRL